ncbi:MAG TPA: hypothetical protein VE172_04125 [Stackebrandtia sp.]|uniref:hypothetical protein n=1 Tax=Stackebrandtia sp. TaxID=2023065 RepID=UPI002D2BEC2F|nr:hypothetical protein [Stackebrandtia sp.]HZE37978.1 hypothetical protein [Stackebrandtia sp.]
MVVVITVSVTMWAIAPARDDACPVGSYKFDELKADMYIQAVSPNGEYLVGRLDDGSDNAFGLWHDGKLSRVKGAPSSGHTIYGNLDVNDSGVVAGGGVTSWRYQGRKFQVLKGTKDLPVTTAVAIANDGTVAGEIGERVAAAFEGETRPVRWAPGATKPTPLRVPQDGNGQVRDISADGTVVGAEQGKGSDYSSAWVWDGDGHGKPLLNNHHKGVLSSNPVSVNGDWVLASTEAGYADMNAMVNDQPKGVVRVNLHSGRANKVTGVTITAMESISGRIDDHGRVFGYADDGRFSVADGKTTKLPGMRSPYPDAESEEEDFANKLLGIAQDGSVVIGFTWREENVRWSCP